MNIANIEKHKFIKLIEFSLENDQFSIDQACDASGMLPREFHAIQESIYGEPFVAAISPAQLKEWKLSSEAFFNYLSFLEYKNAIKSSSRATWFAIGSLVISTLVGLANIL